MKLNTLIITLVCFAVLSINAQIGINSGSIYAELFNCILWKMEIN